MDRERLGDLASSVIMSTIALGLISAGFVLVACAEEAPSGADATRSACERYVSFIQTFDSLEESPKAIAAMTVDAERSDEPLLRDAARLIDAYAQTDDPIMLTSGIAQIGSTCADLGYDAVTSTTD